MRLIQDVTLNDVGEVIFKTAGMDPKWFDENCFFKMPNDQDDEGAFHAGVELARNAGTRRVCEVRVDDYYVYFFLGSRKEVLSMLTNYLAIMEVIES